MPCPVHKQAMKLDQDRIVATALQLMQADGLDRLGMRAVAAGLEVQASALYWHVRDKDTLLGLMAAHFYRSAFQGADDALSAAEWLDRLGHSFRSVLLSYRDSARLCAIAPAISAATPETTDRLAAPLVAFGVSGSQALTAIASTLALTLGWVVYQQSEAMHDHLANMIDFDQAFDAGLRAIVEGLAVSD